MTGPGWLKGLKTHNPENTYYDRVLFKLVIDVKCMYINAYPVWEFAVPSRKCTFDQYQSSIAVIYRASHNKIQESDSQLVFCLYIPYLILFGYPHMVQNLVFVRVDHLFNRSDLISKVLKPMGMELAYGSKHLFRKFLGYILW